MTDSLALPQVFCWTKMGTEAGQPLSDILRRKELERDASGGVFAWGIGNALGSAPTRARATVPGGELEVLFTAMRTAPRSIDSAPTQLVLWLSYMDGTGHAKALPPHTLVTSRGGPRKRGHYALLCTSEQHIGVESDHSLLDAGCARNLVSRNPVGPSQVTSVVLYQHEQRHAQEKLYRVAFRATLHAEGFVQLSTPVALEGALWALYEEACRADTASAWRASVTALREAAQERLGDLHLRGSRASLS